MLHRHRYLDSRNFSGGIKIDPVKAQLSIGIQVCVRLLPLIQELWCMLLAVHVLLCTLSGMVRAQTDKRSTKPQTDLKTLSGGERSFVTICFILALGKLLNVRNIAYDEMHK